MSTMAVRTSKSKYILFIAVIIGVITAFAIMMAIRSYSQLVPVVYSASEEIPAFSLISEGKLRVEMVPATALKKGMYSSASEVTTKASRSIIPPNTPITEGMLSDDATITARLQEIIKKTSNKKLGAFAIPMDGISGLSGKDNLKFGMMVDVIGALNLPMVANKNNKEPVSKIIAPYAYVLDVMGSGSQTAGVIIALEPQQAQELKMAEMSGKIALYLHGYNPDMKASYTTTTTTDTFIQKYINDKQQEPTKAQQQTQQTQAQPQVNNQVQAGTPKVQESSENIFGR